MTTDIQPVGKASVTYHDEVPSNEYGGVWNWTFVDGLERNPAPGLPPHWSMARDVVLAATPYLSDFWDSALRTAVNQIIVRNFTVKDSEDSARRLERSQGMLLDFGGPAMYTESLSAVAQDFFLCDNGAHCEVEYEGKSANGEPRGRPIAIRHLDALRVWRTGNREYPAIYVDYWGAYHKLHAKSWFSITDQPSARLGLWGIGRCAASAAWRTIVLDGALQTYLLEKLSGSRALALYFVKGVNARKIEDAQVTSDEERVRKGHVIYKGALIVPVLDDVQVAKIDLASIPDGFDAAQLRQMIALNFALALGMPYTDIATLQGGQFGTGTQSQVIDESRKGRGVEAFIRQFERKLNRLVLPKRTTVDLFGIDVRDQKAEADMKVVEAGFVEKLITQGVATPQQAANYLADLGIWPAEFTQEDATTGGILTDSGENSKIAGHAETAAAGTPQPQQAPLAPLRRLIGAKAATVPTGKRGRVTKATIDEGVIARAAALMGKGE